MLSVPLNESGHLRWMKSQSEPKGVFGDSALQSQKPLGPAGKSGDPAAENDFGDAGFNFAKNRKRKVAFIEMLR